MSTEIRSIGNKINGIKKNYQCEICKIFLKSKYFYTRHKESRHPVNLQNFICDFDGKVFARKNYLRIHMERHKEEILTCNICMKAYNSKFILKRHLLSHLEQFSCTECDAVFSHKSLLKNHLAVHSKDFLYKCKYCSRMFRNKSARNNHHQIAHKNRNELHFNCKLCNVFFETKEDLRIHSFIHFNGEIKSCFECDQIFKTTRLLNIHLQKHSIDKKFQCDSCLEKFTFKTGLKKHIRLNRCRGPPTNIDENQMTHEEMTKIAKEQLQSMSNKSQVPKEEEEEEVKTVVIESIESEIYVENELCSNVGMDSDDGTINDLLLDTDQNSMKAITQKRKRLGRKHNTYICDMCGESVKYRKNLELHMRDKHLRRSYKCPYCTETFKSKSSFMCHTLSIHGIKQRISTEIYKCSDCDRNFDFKSIFETHKLSHQNIKSHVCTVCNASFKSIGNLRRHNLTHVNDRNFLCDACPKSFKSQAALKVHKNSVHAEVKVYVGCPHCKVIIQEKNLKIHIFNQHTKEGKKKPFVCSICAKSFKNEFLLKRHLEHLHFNTDFGVSYECKQCGLTFNRQRDLRMHSFDHYEGIIYKCECGKKFKSKRLLSIHSVSHASDSIFPCMQCDSVFKTAGGRRKHSVRHHNNLLQYKCEELK